MKKLFDKKEYAISPFAKLAGVAFAELRLI
jgi:hypothetical protein